MGKGIHSVDNDVWERLPFEVHQILKDNGCFPVKPLSDVRKIELKAKT